jgi:uncharacterized protein YacL
MLLTIIAYVLVVLSVLFCRMVGTGLGTLSIGFLLAWAPITFRQKIACFCGGVIGVMTAIVFSYGVFHLLVGPESFTIVPFLVAIISLLFTIRTGFLQSQREKAVRNELLLFLAKKRSEQTVKSMSAATKPVDGSLFVGWIFGIALMVCWFILR